jgi:hypothetical protein
MSLAAITESGPAGAAVAGLNASEVRRSGKPTANAVAFRNRLARMRLFPVDFTGDVTFHDVLARADCRPGKLGTATGITDLVMPVDHPIQTVQSDS